jgi:hypothetical protein
MEKVEEITAVLLEKEVLEGAEFNELLGFQDQEDASSSTSKESEEAKGKTESRAGHQPVTGDQPVKGTRSGGTKGKGKLSLEG